MCNSGVVYSGKLEDGSQFTFGTSGLLYRSNKLMYDRETFTLWGNLTGEPVVGKMATSGLHLKILPMTLTSWSEWKKAHPDTRVLHLDDSYGKRWNYRYLPGLADRARQGVSFPVWNKSKILKDKEEIYGIRIGDHAKAFVIESLLKQRIVHDRIGDVPIVLIIDPESETVRVYRSGSLSLSLVSGVIKDGSGRVYQPQEDALVSGETKLERIPGHVSWWFAWYGFFPLTEVYQ